MVFINHHQNKAYKYIAYNFHAHTLIYHANLQLIAIWWLYVQVSNMMWYVIDCNGILKLDFGFCKPIFMGKSSKF